MPASIAVNQLSVVHASSDGVLTCAPDTCKTPSPGGPVPVPYPNVARSSDAAKTSKRVKCDGLSVCLSDSTFSTSSGDEAGSAGGVVSGKTKGEASFIAYSFDVKFEGKNVPRAFDPMVSNARNTPPLPLLQPPAVPR